MAKEITKESLVCFPRLFHSYILDAVKTIYREEGFKGYYKGMIPALFGVSHGALQFMAYEELKHIYMTKNGGESLVICIFILYSFYSIGSSIFALLLFPKWLLLLEHIHIK